MFTWIVLISALFGSLGLGAEFSEAIPALSGDLCTDDCPDSDAPACDGVCLCACCPAPAMPPTLSLDGCSSIVIDLDPAPVLVSTNPATSAPYHPPR